MGIGARETTMGTTVSERSMSIRPKYESSLLRRPEEARLVRSDIFIQGLKPDEVEMIREASERGLKPNGFEVVGDTLILRFDRSESWRPLREE